MLGCEDAPGVHGRRIDGQEGERGGEHEFAPRQRWHITRDKGAIGDISLSRPAQAASSEAASRNSSAFSGAPCGVSTAKWTTEAMGVTHFRIQPDGVVQQQRLQCGTQLDARYSQARDADGPVISSMSIRSVSECFSSGSASSAALASFTPSVRSPSRTSINP